MDVNKIFEEWYNKNHLQTTILLTEAVRAAFKSGYELGRNDQAAEDEDNLSERAAELAADNRESRMEAMD